MRMLQCCLIFAILLVRVNQVKSVDCFNCKDHYLMPVCLGNKVQCSFGEACVIRFHHGDITLQCDEFKNCDHSDRICCTDNTCLQSELAKITGNPVMTMTTPHPHTTCQDEVTTGDDCHSMQKFGLCSDHIGVRVCPATCGLCGYLNLRFGDYSFCEDKLIDNECTHLKTSNNICADPIANYTCPRTCDMCDVILEGIINDFMMNGTSWAGMTAKPSTTATPTACEDQMTDNGCLTVPNICNSNIAVDVCQKTCGLCDTNLVG